MPHKWTKHDWTDEDDVLVCYLFLHGEDNVVTLPQIAKYMHKHSSSDRPLKKYPEIINMRKGNFSALAPNGKEGLRNITKSTKRAYKKWKDKKPEHKNECRRILGGRFY